MRINTAELEFTNFPFNRFIPDENLIDGDVVKSSAIDKLLQFASIASFSQAPWDFPVCYIRDGMDILNK